MGLGNSRRGAVRNSTAKAKCVRTTRVYVIVVSDGYRCLRRLEAGRSASPYLGSDLGNLSDDGKPASKAKGKSKAKQAGECEKRPLMNKVAH